MGVIAILTELSKLDFAIFQRTSFFMQHRYINFSLVIF